MEDPADSSDEPDTNAESIAFNPADIEAHRKHSRVSEMTFEELGFSKEIMTGLYNCNFRRPSSIQEKTLPLILKNPSQNLIAQSQNGTGKTASFVLTILTRVDTSSDKLQALVLVPTREIARQIDGVIKKIGKFTKITTAVAIPTGGAKKGNFEAHVVIGTPGTVLDSIRRGTLMVGDVKIFVLDEADNMLETQGFGDHSVRVKKNIPLDAQILLFSATYPDNVMEYAKVFAPDAAIIRLPHEEMTLRGIKQLFMDCKDESHKYRVLIDIYHLMIFGATIVFVKRRDTANEIARRMKADGHHVGVLHSALGGINAALRRDQVIDDFRESKIRVLITTNVVARGLDIACVSMVINYDLPEVNGVPDPSTYLHRIGRTGRFGSVGVSVSFVHNKATHTHLNSIEQYFGVIMHRVPTDDIYEMDKLVKSIMKSRNDDPAFLGTKSSRHAGPQPA